MYKILIADDHPLFREAIHNVIADGFPGSEVMETADLDSALGLTQEHDDLDLILLDLNMPGMHGLNGLMSLRNEAPTIPVVIVSAEQDKQVVLQAITYGAVGFITKSSPRVQMTEAIEQILNGNVYLPSDIIRTQKTSPRRSGQEDHSIPPGTAAGADPQAAAGAGAHDQGRIQQADRLQPGDRRDHGEGPRLRDPAQAQGAQPRAGDSLRQRHRLHGLPAPLSPFVLPRSLPGTPRCLPPAP